MDEDEYSQDVDGFEGEREKEKKQKQVSSAPQRSKLMTDEVDVLRTILLLLGGRKHGSIDKSQLELIVSKTLFQVEELTLLSKDDALLVMHHYGWRFGKLMEDWLEDPECVLEKCGVRRNTSSSKVGSTGLVYCEVEMDEFKRSECDAARCGHLFSKAAWRGHCTSAIRENPNAAVLAKCPKCPILLGPDLMQRYLSEEDWATWQDYSLRRFANDSSNVSYCPAPDCPWAILAVDPSDLDDLEVKCAAGHAPFCFRCKKPAHKPASCAEVIAWEVATADGNVTYVQQNCKLCPKCNTAIERTQGCNRVICTRCMTAFCWMCGVEYAKAHNYPAEAWGCNRPPATNARADSESLARVLYFTGRATASAQSADLAQSLGTTDAYLAHVAKLQESLSKSVSVPATAATSAACTSATVPVPCISTLPSVYPTTTNGLIQSGHQPEEDRENKEAVRHDTIEMPWLVAAVLTASEARRMLQYSYVHAYFLKNDSEQALFSEMQAHLEAHVEKLQLITESNALANLIKGHAPEPLAKPAEESNATGAVAGLAPAALAESSTCAGPSDASTTRVPAAPAIRPVNDPSLPLWARFLDWKMEIVALSKSTRNFMVRVCEGVQAGLLMETEYAIGQLGSSGGPYSSRLLDPSATVPIARAGGAATHYDYDSGEEFDYGSEDDE